MARVLTLISVLIVCGITAPTWADLEWQTQRINYTVSIADDKAEVAFKFTNTGDRPVTIESVRTSCGCTTAKLDKQTYQPGESGEVTAVFAFGDRTGVQHKRITVKSSEPAPAPGSSPGSSPGSNSAEGDSSESEPVVHEDYLYLKVTIPEPVKVRPRMVFWRVGEARAAKTVRVTLDDKQPIKLSLAGVEGDGVSAKLQPVEAGKQYELILTPTSKQPTASKPTEAEQASASSGPETAEPDTANKPAPLSQTGPMRTMVVLKADFGDDVVRTYRVLARVMTEVDEQAAQQARAEMLARRHPAIAAHPGTDQPAANESPAPPAR